MKIIFFCISITLFLTGCGSGGGADYNLTNSTSSNEVNMVNSKIYTVYQGDKVVKKTDYALIKITHANKHNESHIELIEGNATIIRQFQ
jgi:uncharacterized lipoprotein YehR (DUF1307 family)